MTENIKQILKSVYKYYPLGSSLNPDEFDDGEFGRIIGEKIEKVMSNEETPWSKAIREFELKFEKMLNWDYIQFPCYKATLEVNENEFYLRRIVVVVSLICPFYTIYVEDCIKFNRFEGIRGVTSSILFSCNSMKDKELELKIQWVNDTIGNHFRGYTFCPHIYLFDYKFAASALQHYDRMPSTDLTKYPVYNLLFDNSFNIDKIIILN
ncbi:hypothetical protein [Niabella hirudinis]|uniref:hypothetical protein n=1 Tax=Niabella hirudinis TaxID=1285929 RepID=UPI003EBDE604